jgi:hypothetical protein
MNIFSGIVDSEIVFCLRIKKQVKRCVSPPHSSFEPMLELSLRSRGERSNIDREHARATP